MSYETENGTLIDSDEGRDFPESCIKCGWTEKVGEPDLVKCEECSERLCEECRTLVDGLWYCFPCFRALPDPEDKPEEAYDPMDAQQGHER